MITRSAKRKPKREFEAVDSKPKTLPVAFGKPPTLAEQIAYHMAASNRYAAAQLGDGSDDDDFGGSDGDWEDEVRSPHELVYDEQLNRELTRYQKEHLDRQRAEFDQKLSAKIQADREKKATVEAAKKAINAEHQKPKNKGPSDPKKPESDED